MVLFLNWEKVAFVISNPKAITIPNEGVTEYPMPGGLGHRLFISNAAFKTELQLAAQGWRGTWISRNNPPTLLLSKGWALLRGRCSYPSQIMGDLCLLVGNIWVWLAWVFAGPLLAATVYDSVNKHDMDSGGPGRANSPSVPRALLHKWFSGLELFFPEATLPAILSSLFLHSKPFFFLKCSMILPLTNSRPHYPGWKQLPSVFVQLIATPWHNIKWIYWKMMSSALSRTVTFF